MNGPGYGTPWLRIDHDLVDRVLAHKRRQRLEPLDYPESVRPVSVKAKARKVVG